VLMKLCVLMAPFTPFFTEVLYQNLRNLQPIQEQKDSVHYFLIPSRKNQWLNPEIERAVSRMQDVVQLGRIARERRTKPLKIPLKELIVYQKNPEYIQDLKKMESYILSELNVKSITYHTDTQAEVLKIVLIPDNKRLGQRLKKDSAKVVSLLKELPAEELKKLEETGKILVAGHEVTSEDVKISYNFIGNTVACEASYNSSVLVVLNIQEDPQLKREGILRTIISRVQKLRKEAGLSANDADVVVYYDIKQEEKEVSAILGNFKLEIEKESNSKLETRHSVSTITPLATATASIFGIEIEFCLCKKSC